MIKIKTNTEDEIYDIVWADENGNRIQTVVAKNILEAKEKFIKESFTSLYVPYIKSIILFTSIADAIYDDRKSDSKENQIYQLLVSSNDESNVDYPKYILLITTDSDASISSLIDDKVIEDVNCVTSIELIHKERYVIL